MANKDKNKVKYSINSNYISGCRFDNWIRLLWQNKFRIKPSCIWKACYITFASFVMFFPAMLEKLIYGKRIRNTKIDKGPVFILGHWRSGTTYLFNVLSQDEQFGYFDAVSVFAHNYFLLCGKPLRKLIASSMPDKRPMDNIKYTTYVPQEELYAYGSQIPECIIHMSAFPKNADYYKDMAFTKNMSPRVYKRFKKAYTGIIKKITFARDGKCMLLKSPDNTCHVDALLDMFPNSKYVHIYRNPYKVIISTFGLFKTMFPMFSLQGFPSDEFVEDYIIDLYGQLYDQYIKDKELIPQGNLIEIKYEDFVKSPIETLEDIYTELGIDGFEQAKPKFEDYIKSLGNYKTNNFTLSDELIEKINTKLGRFVDYFGYERM